jgi:4-alpha-glucanotransferase
LYGIQTSYLDMRKQPRLADPESLLLVLCALGAGVEKFADVTDALARRKEKLKNRKVEPVMVAWDGELGNRKFEFGYHTIEVKGQETFVISAPVKAFDPLPLGEGRVRVSGVRRPATLTRPRSAADLSQRERYWGVFAPIYALHSKRNPVAGDLTDFEQLMDWMGTLGGTVAATLPLLGAFLNKPFEPSPYSPATRLFWNEFYVDVERIPEFTERSLTAPRKTKLVDYRSVMAYKRRILEDLAEKHFADATPQRLQAFGKFIRENEDVADYAQFRAVTDRQEKGWNAWPARMRDGKLARGDYDERTKNYHLYAQWIVQEQLHALAEKAHAKGQLLYLDLPLGLHPDSYDVWRHREFFVSHMAGGAPPDPVFTKGQNWGFPPMNPEAMRLNRYQYFIELLRNHFRFARLLRIDHVMGLHRLYWIPDGLTGDKGVYVEYPAEELYAILSLESHRYQTGIVGENLGTVPPAVNRALSRHNIRQMYVVQYEIMGDPENPTLRPATARTVTSLNTHDMPPFEAFLTGLDIEDRLDLGLLDEKAANKERKQRTLMKRKLGTFRHAIEFQAKSMADIVLINMEDLWQETLPQNVPATNQETRPNWRRRMRPSVEQIRTMAGIAEVLTDVFAHRSRPVPV